MSDKPRRNGVGPCKADMFPLAVYGQRFIPQLFAHVRKRHEAFFHNESSSVSAAGESSTPSRAEAHRRL